MKDIAFIFQYSTYAVSKCIRHSLFTAVVLSTAVSAHATTTNLSPTEDAHVRSVDPITNYANYPNMEVRLQSSVRIAYMKFDLSGISGTVTSATLTVQGSTSNSTQTTGAYSVAGTSWTESGIVYNNRPSLGNLLDTVQISSVYPSFASHQFDVTDYVADEVAASHSAISFGFQNTDDSGSLTRIKSSEAGGSEPVLSITYTTATAPSITTQPADQTIDIGQTAEFTVAASGSPAPTYQWRKNGNDIGGATSATLTIPNADLSDAGSYDVVVTNGAGSVTSSPATLAFNSSSVLISEDFSESAANFTGVAGGTWSVTNEAYVLTNPASGTSGSGNGNVAVHNTTVSNDFTLTVNASTTNTASSWNDFVVIFNYQDSSNYYWASFNESNDGNTSGIFKIVGGTQTQLTDIATSINGDTTYEVRIVRTGSDYAVYLDSSLVASATDATFGSGKIGFGSLNDGATFDDLYVTGESTALISEDFSTSASNFTEISGGTWSVSSGAYVLSSPASTSSGNGNISVHNTVVAGNFTLTVDASVTGTGNAWNDISILFGYQDTNNHYFASFNESNDDMTSGIFKVEGGTPTQLTDITTAIDSDTVYGISVLRIGTTLQVYLGQTLVASTTDSTFMSGKVGFGTRNDGATFDNLTVTSETSIEQVVAPTFSPTGGTYSSSQSVSLSTPTSGATIRYTTDGSTPTSSSGTVYSGSISVSSTTTIKAIAYKSGLTDSAVSSAAYTINLSQVAAPVFNPGGGTYGEAQSVSISSTTSGATIRYTTDGSTPTSSSGIVYSSAISINSTTTLKAIAFKGGMTDSAVTSATYTIQSQVAAPSFSPSAGTYTSAQSVTISSTTSGATIRYTINGSTPTSSNGTVYSGAVSISSTTTLKAIAFKSGMVDSTVTTGIYTINTGGGPVKPSASNTGLTDPGILTSSGSITVTTNGTTIENKYVSGTIRVQANNVTIRNCLIDTGGFYGIQCTYGNTALLIEDCEIRGMQSAAVYGGNFTARRLHVWDSGADGFKPTSNYVVESCYIHSLGYIADSHADGLQMVAGSNGIIRYNTIDIPASEPGYNNSQCIIIQTNNNIVDNILIDQNWINGGGYSVQIRDKGNGYGAPTNISITNNQFGTDCQYGIILAEGSPTITGNIWEATGQPAP